MTSLQILTFELKHENKSCLEHLNIKTFLVPGSDIQTFFSDEPFLKHLVVRPGQGLADDHVVITLHPLRKLSTEFSTDMDRHDKGYKKCWIRCAGGTIKYRNKNGLMNAV